MVPHKSGNVAGVANLIRRSVYPDTLNGLGVGSHASATHSDTVSANGRSISLAKWNSHYLIPRDPSATGDDSTPVNTFVAPDWVLVTRNCISPTVCEPWGPTPFPGWNAALKNPSSTNTTYAIGRYAYAVYDEGGLLDMNVAGYPTNTTVPQSGRKGSLAYADLTALGNYPIPNGSGGSAHQVDTIVGWRNYATTQPNNLLTDTNFAENFQSDPTRATAYFTYVINNTSGFLSPSTTAWQINPNVWRTDQSFVQRQELIAFRKATQFSLDALQYLSTFSRETNAPSFSPPFNAMDLGAPDNGPGNIYAYRDNAANPSTAPINPNFLFRRVPSPTPAPTFNRFDGTTAVGGEPLVKTRFPLSRLAWITYKGPSALRTLPPQTPTLLPTDSNYDMWALQWLYGIPASYLQSGTAANIKTCFGLTFGGNAGDPWTYTNPAGTSAASGIMRLDQAAAAGREPDFFELLQAGILSGSLGQSTEASPPGSTFQDADTTGANVFPDIHMSSTMQHLLTIGACYH